MTTKQRQAKVEYEKRAKKAQCKKERALAGALIHLIAGNKAA